VSTTYQTEKGLTEEARGSQIGRNVFEWATRWQVVTALVAALFALPIGTINLYNSLKDLWGSPDTQATVSVLEVSSDAGQKEIDFTLNFGLLNRSNIEDMIREGKAWFEMDSRQIPLDVIAFRQGGDQVISPFPVTKALPRGGMTCSIASKLSDLDWEAFQQPGLRRLFVELKGSNDSRHILDFCFWLNGLSPKRLIEQDPRCEDSGDGRLR
jgi:hypothetical protein